MNAHAFGSRWRRLAMAAFAWAAMSGPAAGAPPVAMVTDLVGGNSATGVGGSAELWLLAELAPGATIQLDPGSRMVIVYYESGSEYLFKGPGTVTIGVDEPIALAGADPEEHQVLSAGDDVVIRPAGMAQASLVMRGADPDSKLQLDSLVGTKTLDARPVFRWLPLAGVESYVFVLTDDAGETLIETDVAGTELALPAEVTLETDITYTWEVEAHTPDGAMHGNWGDFSIAEDDERALVEKVRPADTAPVSRRVMFAVMLEQMELHDEARKYWKALLKERGDDPRLRQLAGE